MIKLSLGPESSPIPITLSLMTYKLVGDNLDKNVKPSDDLANIVTLSLYTIPDIWPEGE